MLWLLILVSATGCEDDLTAVKLSDNAFTLYGIINPLEDIQAVRVYQIDEILTPIKPDPIDATVRSTDLDTGKSVEWQDSVVSFPDGKFGHVFWAPFKPEHGHRFRIEVERPGAAVASATTTVPPESVGEVLPYEVNGGLVTQPILWHDAPNLINIRVRYYTNVGRFDYDYNIAQEDVSEGKKVVIQIYDDTLIIFRRAIFDGIQDVILDRMDMRVVVTDEDWTPPGGVFDPHVFSVPGTFSNVDNGFGFLGSGYPAILEWRPSNDLRKELGFVEQ